MLQNVIVFHDHSSGMEPYHGCVAFVWEQELVHGRGYAKISLRRFLVHGKSAALLPFSYEENPILSHVCVQS